MQEQVFGNSPDETAYCRHLLDKESVANSLTMIQPQLLAYSINMAPRPVLLDVRSIVPEEILVLDSYFIVMVHCGSVVAQWRASGYADMPEHQSFRQELGDLLTFFPEPNTIILVFTSQIDTRIIKL